MSAGWAAATTGLKLILIFGFLNLVVLVTGGFLLRYVDDLVAISIELLVLLLVDWSIAIPVRVVILNLLVLIVHNLVLINFVLVQLTFFERRRVLEIGLLRLIVALRMHSLRIPLRAILIQMLLTVVLVLRRVLETPLTRLEVVQGRVSVMVKPVILHQLALLNLLIIQDSETT